MPIDKDRDARIAGIVETAHSVSEGSLAKAVAATVGALGVMLAKVEPTQKRPHVLEACISKLRSLAAEETRPHMYTHLVVIIREGVPEVVGFHDGADALAFADRAGAQPQWLGSAGRPCAPHRLPPSLPLRPGW